MSSSCLNRVCDSFEDKVRFLVESILLEPSLASDVCALVFHVDVPYLSDCWTCCLDFLLFDAIVGQTVFAAVGETGGWAEAVLVFG